MELTNITLKNYKGIIDLSASFKPGVNLVIGNNGAGKTSLLNGASVAISKIFSWINVPVKEIMQEDIYVTAENSGDATSNLSYHMPVEVVCDICINGKKYHSYMMKTNESSHSSTTDVKILEYIKSLVDDKRQLPLVSFQNAGRGTVKYSGKSNISLKQGKTERIVGYKGAFDTAMNFDDIENWCLRMDFAEYQNKKEVREYRLFKNIVASFSKFLQDKAIDSKVYYSSVWGSLVYVENGQETPFYNLSAGFQSVLCMAMELAYRAAVLNPELKDVKNLEGVVLIDEIEMHLHPAWQWKIVDALKSTFPKVQFIIATHSPIILSSAKDASILLMKSVNEIVDLENAFGYKINDVLSLRQGTTDMPKEISIYYDKIEKLLDTYDEKGLQLLQESVCEKYGKDSHVSKMINDFITVNKWIEEA